MSKARNLRRQRERAVEKHLNVLGELLGQFYTFLERKEKPSDEEIRAVFLAKEKHWKNYCRREELSEGASVLFNQEVAQTWKQRYSTKDTTQK
jgi:hypothetical protein|nr:MAG TPA: hypothetical protein [Caudoviricetes sp.]